MGVTRRFTLRLPDTGKPQNGEPYVSVSDIAEQGGTFRLRAQRLQHDLVRGEGALASRRLVRAGAARVSSPLSRDRLP